MTGCSVKIVFFFTIHSNPSLAYISVSFSKLSTQYECRVTPIGRQFFVQPIAAECLRGRSGKLSRILGKNTIFNEHPVFKSPFFIKSFQPTDRRTDRVSGKVQFQQCGTQCSLFIDCKISAKPLQKMLFSCCYLTVKTCFDIR